jgi:hypothetical protein
VVVLDRTLTPAGQRRLKDLRCLGRGSGVAWPSPGVFSVVQIAEKILIRLAQEGFCEGPRDLISNEALVIGLWSKSARSPRLASFRRELKAALKLAPVGLSFDEWKEVLFEMESNGVSTSSDLKLWSERILLFLSATRYADSLGLALTMWDHVARVLQEVPDTKLADLPWASLFERNPFLASDVSFTVPELQDPQPLEERFLRKLPLPTTRLRLEANDEFPLTQLVEAPVQGARTADDLSIAWAFDTSPPGPVETVAALAGDFPIDIAVKTTEDDNEEIRILSLYTSSLADALDTLHPFFRYGNQSRFLHDWGLKASSTSADIVDAWVQRRDPALSGEILATMRGLSLSELSEVFAYLAESPLFAVERRAFSHPRLDPRGAPLVTLVDLPFMGSRDYALWGVAKDFEKHLAPTATAVLGKQDFPPSLRKILEARGLLMPDPEREQRALLGALQEIKENLRVIAPKAPEVFERSAPLVWSIPQIAERQSFSPSALESYAECSLRYYTERVLRPERVGDWDPVPIDPLETGQWVHAVLEDFLKDPHWDDLGGRLETLLVEHREKIFLSPHSTAYSKILAQEEKILVEKLSEHLTNFEMPLLKIMGDRTGIDTERSIQSRFLEQAYHGKIDRLDRYGNGFALLWDYKTGTITQTKAVSQIEKHKFQWHLYRELLKGADAKLSVAGGGYLNPLDPTKSRLVAFAPLFDPAKLEAFAELCLALGHPLEIIADESAVVQALSIEIGGLREKLLKGIVAAEGLAVTCRRCSSHGLCGKPYFESEADDELA